MAMVYCTSLGGDTSIASKNRTQYPLAWFGGWLTARGTDDFSANARTIGRGYKTAWDVYHQIKLFHQDDKTDLPVDPPNLRSGR
jgi:hypothetical protein